MSALNRQGIPESLLRGDGDRLAFVDALTILCGFSLIIEESRGGYFEMHRLVQLATRKWLDAHGEMIKWNQKALMMVSTAFPTGVFENWTECVTLLPHAEAVLSYSLLDRGDLLNKASILHNLSWYLWLKGDFRLSKLKIDRAIEIRRDHLATKDSELLASIGLCATVLSSQGRHEEAEQMHRQTLELKEKVLGHEHPSTLTSMNNLALALSAQGRYEEAEQMHRQTLELKEKVLGHEHPGTLLSIWCLASLLHSRRLYQNSNILYQRAYAGYRKILGLEHPDSLSCLKQHMSLLGDMKRVEATNTYTRGCPADVG
jgi:tetratricopeptide (TPR) repeat protein